MSNKQENSGNLPSAALPLHNQAEEALPEPKQFLKSVIDGLPDIIAVLDDQGNILLTNKSYRVFAEKNGLKPGTFSNSTNYLSVCDSASGEDSEEASLFAKGIREVLSGRCQLFELEYPCHSPDEKRWFIGRVLPLTYLGSRQVIVAHANITVLKQAEEALRRSQELLNTTQRLSKTGGWEWNPGTQTMLWTEETYRIHGFMPGKMEPGSAEHINRSLACYGPEARPIILGAFQRCVEQGEPYDLELPFTNAKGSQLWVRTIAHPVLQSGKVVRVIGNIVDITERKQAEETLRKNEQLISSIFRSAPVGIGLVADRVLKAVNSRLCEMTGYKEQELLNQSARKLYPDDESFDYVGRAKYAQITDRGTGDMETQWRRKDGTIIDILLSSTPIDLNDWSRGVTFTALDITGRKQAEQALHQKTQEIEQFAYIVSHDLKSPLITVQTFLAMLRKDLLESDQQQVDEDINFIDKAADKMHLLLEALLKYSRIGRKETPPQTLSTSQQVEKCVTVLAGILPKDKIQVSTSGLSHQLHGDALHFEQIWQNLIENAVKYMGDQGHPQIEIGANRQDDEVIFYVRDNGMGIAPEHTERIFNLFSQLNPNSDGSGLGLALVKKIVTIYQGRIWVESEGEKRGSCFYFTLPGALIKADKDS